MISQAPPRDEGIHEVIDLLKDVSDEDGNGKEQDELEHVPLRHVENVRLSLDHYRTSFATGVANRRLKSPFCASAHIVLAITDSVVMSYASMSSYLCLIL